MCRLLLELKEENIENKECDNIWSDFVSDLWKRHLPHLREEELLFDIDSSHYGFQCQEDYNEEEERSRTTQQFQLDFTYSHKVSKQEDNLSEETPSGCKLYFHRVY